MPLRLHPLRFQFVALESIHFAPGKSANILRGALGTIFRGIACMPECPGARQCDCRATCPYARLFEPSAIGPGPSGLADWPRPFVFRAWHLDGQTFDPGASFSFDLNLFDTAAPVLTYLVLTFAQLAREGLGPGRRKVELRSVVQLSDSGECGVAVYENGTNVHWPVAPLELDLEMGVVPISRLQVNFLTPTELKSGHHLATQPEFGVLAARVRDRISTLRELYGCGPLDIDFLAFGERAAVVRMTRCDISQVDVQRRSSKTKQVHSLGGFVGSAEYEGDLTEFLPYLQAAKWTGVGRQTVWGKGEIETIAVA